jgi:3-mercaptopyruvate sulfurtransferase SseA
MMRRLFLVLLIFLLFGPLPQKASVLKQQAGHNLLIESNEWLAQHLKDDSLVLLQVGTKDEFTAAHIPGAQFIQLADISTPADRDWRLSFQKLRNCKPRLRSWE